MICAASLLLTGCGWQWPEWATIDHDPLGFLTSDDREAKPPPPAPQNSPLSLKADYDPLVNAKTFEAEPGGALGSLGLNLDMYFDPGIKDQDVRLDRLERAVIALHKDLRVIAPQLQGMPPGSVLPTATIAPPPPIVTAMPVMPSNTAVTSTTPMQLTPSPQPVLMAPPPTPVFHGLAPMPGMKIQTIPSASAFSPPVMPQTTMASPVAPPPVTTTPPATPAPIPAQTIGMQPVMDTPPPAPPPVGETSAVNQGPRDVQNGSSAIVSGIRVGQHPDKVRVVFDVTKKTNYSADLDNSEHILVVEMPQAQWKTPTTTESFGSLPVVKSYKVESFNGGAGNIFILQLKKDTQIVMQGKYPALSGEGERIVIDLKK